MVSKQYQIELSHGDLIVSAVAYRDYIVVVTERGWIYKVRIDD